MLKEAGIGGVEINPIKFPARTNDLGKPAIQWLSPEWIELLKFTFAEARSLGMTCDLIVGSGWPFGAEWLEGEERSQAVVIGTKNWKVHRIMKYRFLNYSKKRIPQSALPFPGEKWKCCRLNLFPQ